MNRGYLSLLFLLAVYFVLPTQIALAQTTFGSQQIICDTANGAISVYAADLDGDDDDDVLAAALLGDQVVWYENLGGSFGVEQTISATSDYASGVYAKDLDGDNDADVLVASENDNTVAWFENLGGSFGPKQVISTASSEPSEVFAADLDGDGDYDVLSASLSDDKIAWYENDGSGNFGAQQVITTSADAAWSVYAADLDGDGDLDVLSASAGDDKIAWYENDGSGTFGEQQVITTNAADSPTDVYAADLDGDGDYDVLSASELDDKIAMYENLGGGIFGAQQVISTAADGAYSVYAIDFDGDGDVDVLSASGSDDKIAWYENDGSGAFSTQQVISTAADGARDAYAANLDGDGDFDVVSASVIDDKVAWYENLSAAGVILTSPNGGETITAGTAEQITWTSHGVSTVTIDYSTDDGASWNPITTGETASTGSYGWTVPAVSTTALVRITDDGGTIVDQSDAAFTITNPVVSLSSPSGAEYWNAGDVETVAWTSQDVDSVLLEYSADNGSTWETIASSVAAADGSYNWTIPDVTTSQAYVRVSDKSNPSVFDVNSTSFAIAVVFFSGRSVVTANGDYFSGICAADLDGDGDYDVLSASFNDSTIAWYENDGSGLFGAQQTISTDALMAAAVYAADLDGDADLDVLSACAGDSTIAWYENDGSGTFGAEQIITVHADYAFSVYAADLDNDGDYDALSASSNDDKIAWYENDGAGNFGVQQVISLDADSPTYVYADDLDNDGDQDVLSAAYNEIAWYENDGDGTFGPIRVISDADVDGPTSTHTADLDLDGDQDVLSSSNFDDKIAWYENDGDGNFGAQQVITLDADNAQSVYSADLDGDGDQDVLSASSIDDKIAWYQNDGAGNFGAQQVIETGDRGLFIVRAADFDLDGDQDVFATAPNDIFNPPDIDEILWYANLSNVPITPPITLASLDGGETLFAAGGALVEWKSFAVEFVDIDYSTDGGSTWETIAADVSGAWGSYPWTVPSVSTTNAMVRVSDAADAATNAVSAATFSIAYPSLSLLAPTGGELLETNAPFTIEWRSFDTDSIRIDYSSDAGAVWSPLAVVPSTDTTYNWMTPSEPTSRAMIRISDYEQTVFHESGVFSIYRPNSWAGSVSDDWSNANNWGDRSVPDDLTDVSVPPTANDPVVRSPITSVYIAGATIESGAALRLEAEVDTFRTRRDVVNRGTIVAVGETEFIVGGDWINEPETPTDLGFVPGLSTVALTDSGTASGEFYNLKIDSGATVTIKGKVSVKGKLSLSDSKFSLAINDTLTIDSDDSTAVEGEGLIYGGTVVRTLRSGSRAVYRFESPLTTVRFPDGDEPDWYAMSTIFGDPDTLIPAAAKPTELVWIVVPDAVLDTAAQTFTIEDAEENGIWTFGFIDSATGKPKPDEIAAGTRFMRRTYRGSSGRNIPKPDTTTAGPTYTFRWDKADMPPAADTTIEDDWSELLCFTLGEPVGSEREETAAATPTIFALEQNYPNPFNPATTISYALPEAATVRLTVFNVLGERVATLVDGKQEAGFYEASFNASELGSGVYFYRIDALGASGERFQETRKMLLVK